MTTTTDELTTNGRCSLREAIRNANANARVHPDCPAGSGADTIILPSGTYGLSIGGQDDDDAATGDLDITGDLTINGQAPAIVDAKRIDRVFHLLSGKTTINHLTIRGGAVVQGAGIHVNGGATLELNQAVVAANNAGDFGGGIYNEGTLQVAASTIRDNQAIRGGGILAQVGLTTTILNSTIRDNNGGKLGGGIGVQAPVTVIGTTITGNRAGNGGGVFVLADFGGTITLTNARITGNHTGSGSGGGIWVQGPDTVTATNTTVANNTPDNCQPDNLIPGCT